jgi:capping protein beta
MRRLPPQQIEKNLSDLIDLVPDLCEELLSSIDQPLKIASDKKVGKDYLLCDYNRDGDSYRYYHNKSIMTFPNLPLENIQ